MKHKDLSEPCFWKWKHDLNEDKVWEMSFYSSFIHKNPQDTSVRVEIFPRCIVFYLHESRTHCRQKGVLTVWFRFLEAAQLSQTFIQCFSFLQDCSLSFSFSKRHPTAFWRRFVTPLLPPVTFTHPPLCLSERKKKKCFCAAAYIHRGWGKN